MKEFVHAVLVSRQDHDQVVAVVFHHLQQYLDRFRAVVALVLRLVQVIGLVDEQHAAHRLLDDFLGLGRGVADVLPDQVVARDGNQVAFAHIAQAMQYLRHAQRDGGLAGAGIAGETHVQRRSLRAQREFLAQAIHQQQRRDLADARLDRLEADQLAVEFVQHFLHIRGFQFRFQVYRRVVRQGCFGFALLRSCTAPMFSVHTEKWRAMQ